MCGNPNHQFPASSSSFPGIEGLWPTNKLGTEMSTSSASLVTNEPMGQIYTLKMYNRLKSVQGPGPSGRCIRPEGGRRVAPKELVLQRHMAICGNHIQREQCSSRPSLAGCSVRKASAEERGVRGERETKFWVFRFFGPQTELLSSLRTLYQRI